MRKYALALVVLGFLCAYIAPLNYRPLAIPDETRYAEIPREMVAKGDWVVPRMNGLRYFEKPVMGYWLTALSFELFGEHRFAVRFPSAFATGISALALALLVRKITRRDSAAILTAAIFLTSLEVFAVGTFAVLDAPFSMFVTLTMVFFFAAYAEPMPRWRTVFLILCGISCGMAFLTKGFLALAVPSVAILPFLLIERKIKDAVRLAILPAVLALLTVLPWAILIHLREPDYWRHFFWVEHIQRFFVAQAKQQHSEPIWFLVPFLLVGSVPWIFLVPAAIQGWRDEREQRSLVRFAFCWFVFPFVLFSVSRGKLATYILPCYAPMAVALAIGIINYLKRDVTRAFKIGAVISACFGILLISAIIFGQTVGIDSSAIFSPDEKRKLVLAIIASCAWIILSLCSAAQKTGEGRVALYAAAPLMLLIVVPFIVPDRINHDDRYLPEALIHRNMDKISPDSLIVTDGDDAPALCWILKRDDIGVGGDGGELGYGLSQIDSTHRLVTDANLAERIRNGDSRGKIILIEEREDVAETLKSMPEPLFQDHENAFVFVQF